ncbi:MAG: helix-turn-helix transcriptional regulator [Spirochaetes bacterium]|nr:helix-turn-helix transcriptional regulator [Spirochaetota bacterium]
MGTMDVALNIKKLRESKGYTLDVLAKKVRVTKGFLSQVENFRTLPSLPLLYQIAQALEADPAALLAGSKPDTRYVYTPDGKGEVIEREHPESGFIYRTLAKDKQSKTMEPFLLELPPKSTRKSVTTSGDEFIYLLEGTITFHLGEEAVAMKAGDSLYFEGEVPHYPENSGGKRALLIVVYSITY